MGAQIVRGKVIAEAVYAELAAEIPGLIRQTGRHPVLVSIYVGSDPAIEIYVRSQNRVARELGIEYRWYQLPDTVQEAEVLRRLDQLNRDPDVTGIILQLPLPAHLHRSALVNHIAPQKDVDGTHPENVGATVIGDMRIGSCTALAVMRLLESTGIDVRGREAVIVGHSDLVGKPLSLMLVDRLATVTICHIATAQRGRLAEHVQRAEILVVAAGAPEVIKGAWVREGAAVIDVGIILQLPLPAHLHRSALVNHIAPQKDVDGTHPENVGATVIGDMRIGSCTALAVMRLLESTGIDVRGREAVIVGHSDLVGKPLSLMLVDRLATVTICHIATAQRGRLAEHVQRAEILVVAAGAPEVIKGAWVREGAAVIDVGINQVGSRWVGDVEFAEASGRAAFITPVPGGVGPVTLSMLMSNTVSAFRAQMEQSADDPPQRMAPPRSA